MRTFQIGDCITYEYRQEEFDAIVLIATRYVLQVMHIDGSKRVIANDNMVKRAKLGPGIYFE